MYCGIKYEFICLTAKAWLKLGHGTRRLHQTEQICNGMAAKEKNQDQSVAVTSNPTEMLGTLLETSMK